MANQSLPTDVLEYLEALDIVEPEILQKIQTMGVWSVSALERATFDDFCNVEPGKRNVSFGGYV